MPNRNIEIVNQLLGIAHNGLLVIDQNKRVQFANDAAVTIFGWRKYTNEKPQPKAYFLFNPEIGDLYDSQNNLQRLKRNPLDRVIEEQKSIDSLELIWKKKNGQMVYLSINAQPYSDGAVVSVSNISSYKSEVQWRQHLMRVVGHELKNPLASILALAETITFLNEEHDVERRNEYLEKIKNRVRSTTRLVNDFLDTTRLRSGNLQFRDRPQPIAPFVRLVVEDFQLSNPTHWVSVEGDSQAQVNFDAIRLTQVLENLMGNAVKYSEEGSEIKVVLKENKSKGKSPDGVTITVIDEGQGIPRKEIHKVFDLYYQVREAGRQPKGLGLGLFLVKEILHHYHSQAKIVSNVGKGTSVSFTLLTCSD